VQDCQAEQGGYSQNDLHRVADGDFKNRPGRWTRSERAKELVTELVAERSDVQKWASPASVVKGGKSLVDRQGTFVVNVLIVELIDGRSDAHICASPVSIAR
jgi:hypothetical protein